MTALLSLNSRPAPSDNLVISTREVIKPLLDVFQKYDMDEDVLLGAVMHALEYERTARDELSFLCVTPVEQWLHEHNEFTYGEQVRYCTEAARLANALNKLGEHLIQQFKRYRLYTKGYLPYEYLRRMGNDLIVTRLMIPEIDPPRYKTPERFDLEDFYHRFEIR